ncbi:hypothetical protein [Acinetobacter baumannii]
MNKALDKLYARAHERKMKNLEYFRGKSILELIKSKVYIKKIHFNATISEGNYRIFMKFYNEHLASKFKNYLLTEQKETRSYTWGRDACGHPNRGLEYNETQFYPFFKLYTSTDDGYLQRFEITPYEQSEESPKFEKSKESALSILELLLYMVENHDKYLEHVEYSINENISFPMYLDTLHPKNRLETYKVLGFTSFDNFSSALTYAKIGEPGLIFVDRNYYIVSKG